MGWLRDTVRRVYCMRIDPLTSAMSLYSFTRMRGSTDDYVESISPVLVSHARIDLLLPPILRPW